MINQAPCPKPGEGEGWVLRGASPAGLCKIPLWEGGRGALGGHYAGAAGVRSWRLIWDRGEDPFGGNKTESL